ncbi:hypothetical protein M0534_08475 [Methylonatrum kenyense]|uniref:hypothetical protein n=1 Tax=Methylonatrum kenyense TaxID=455253 RepID=UPI0020C02D29|nr:hypothetical protein [Methylonatrum kenyense]MCK8516359.1 hypothetical protein [Methylonatrum kenyense]
METAVAAAIYGIAIPLWLYLWHAAEGFSQMRNVRYLWLPFTFALLYLGGNLLLVLFFHEVGLSHYEESRFAFIGERAMIAVQATASVLIVATIVYGLTIRKVPLNFIRFMVFSFVALLGFMAPILWVPESMPGGFATLRHFQTVALIFGLFYCVSGIVVLLKDLVEHGEARVHISSADRSWTE